MRALLLLLVFLLFGASLPAVAAAQPPATTLDELSNRVWPDAEVWVTDASGKEVKARVIEVTVSTVAIETKSGRRDLRADEVERVRRTWRDPVWTGALIGGVAALAYPLWYFQGNYESGETLAENVDAVLMAGAVGACVGTWIDSMVKGKKVVYKRGSASRLTLAPAISRGSVGVHFTVRPPTAK